MLTENKILKARPREQEYSISDGGCLYLRILPSGTKVWVYRPRSKGAKKQTLGRWPEMGLKEAREARDNAAVFLKTGKPAGMTFGDLAKDWFTVKVLPEKRPNTIYDIEKRLKNHLLPAMGNKQLDQITAPVILSMCRDIERAGHIQTARICRSTVSCICRYGIACGLMTVNPARDLSDALRTASSKQLNYSTDIAELQRIYSAVSAIGNIQSKLCMFIALTFVRKNEALSANWSEIDLTAGVWTIPGERMKMKRIHVVPLSRQCIAILQSIPVFARKGLVFTNGYTGKPFSPTTPRNIFKDVCNRIGAKNIVPHGWRHSASTILNEAGFNPDAIERQLSHAPGGVRGVYNKAEYLPDRKAFMQWWADLLTGENGALPPLPESIK